MDPQHVYDKVIHTGAAPHKTSWRGHCWFAIWLVNRLRPRVTVDLGVDNGFSSQCFAAAGSGVVYAVDTFRNDYDIEPDLHKQRNVSELPRKYERVANEFAKLRETAGIGNVVLMPTTFESAANTFVQDRRRVDLLHVDGVHTAAAVRRDYETWQPLLRPNAVVLFHDLGSFKEVRNYFVSLSGPRLAFLHSAGLGVLAPSEGLLAEIAAWARHANLTTSEPPPPNEYNESHHWARGLWTHDYYHDLPLSFERAMAFLPRAPTCEQCSRNMGSEVYTPERSPG